MLRTGGFLMEAKAEKTALFRYGLVAPLILEPLPRGELVRRAREIAEDSPGPLLPSWPS